MGSPIEEHAMMYKAVVQAVLLYRRKIWVVMDTMMTVIEGFHHRIARRIVGMTARKSNGGEWEWASVGAALETTGICPIRDYTRICQATISEYVVGRPIYKFFTSAEKMEGSSRLLIWWY